MGDSVMDVMTGLAALGQAIKITKDLRDIERDLDAAAYRAQMADLYSNLGDAKIALTDARELIHERDQQIAALTARIANLTSGEACPLCQEGKMKVTSSRPDPIFGPLGHQERTLTCQNAECAYVEKRKVAPR